MHRILVVTARWPWPTRRGDQLRAVQFLEALRKGGATVTLLAPRSAVPLPTHFTREPPLRVETYRRTVGDRAVGLARILGGGQPLQSAPFEASDLRRRLLDLAPRHDLVVVQLARLESIVEAVPAAALYVDFIDCLSLSVERRARYDRLWRRPFLLWEAGRMRRAERSMLQRAAGGAVVCSRDRDALLELLPEVTTRLALIPLAVAPSARRPRTAPGESLILSGNMGYFVNRDAAGWFLEEVWPRLREARPGIAWEIAGSRPSRSLRGAARRAGVEVFAEPGHLGDHIAAADVAVAPLRAGAGVPVKILEAWANGVPVVASSWATAGTLGRDEHELLVADRPADWLAQILRLLDEPTTARALGEAGRSLLARSYSVEAASATLRESLALHGVRLAGG